MQSSLCDYCGLRPKFQDSTKTHDFCGRACAAKANGLLKNTMAVSGQQKDLCIECKQRPKFKDSVQSHDFCGKACAAKAKANVSSSNIPTVASSNLCVVCKQKPKLVEGTKTHDYCSKACAQKAKAANNAPATSGMCKMCKTRPVHSAGNRTYAFCGKACAEKACKFCKEKPRHFDSKSQITLDYCGKKCAQKDRQVNGNTAGTIPGIAELSPGDPRYQSVAHQFKVSWRHPTPNVPKVKMVYQVMGTVTSIDAYKAYRKSLEDAGKFQSQNMSEGNEERRWHGTKRTCLLGDPGHNQLCSDSSCSLCNIIRNSYDLSHIGAAHGWGRFGRGLYTSSTSSKSDNPYTKNVGAATSSPYKAMLLNKVAVGRGYKTKIDMPTTKAPPTGYDSVLGEVGFALNYDELVVYRSDAIIPTYLVIYEP